MAKKSPENNRRQLIEQQRRKAKAGERRATVLTIVITSLIAIGIIGGAVYVRRSERGPDVALNAVGATAETAACDPIKEEPIPKEATEEAVKHTARNGDPVQYAIAPPTSGRHNPTPLPVGSKKFYSRGENPPPERAVHNLEHGYVVVWYDSKATPQQVELLERAGRAAEGKILIVPWTRQDFPDDKHIVITAWAMKQACRDVSGTAIQEFFDKHGGAKSKAPEKNAL